MISLNKIQENVENQSKDNESLGHPRDKNIVFVRLSTHISCFKQNYNCYLFSGFTQVKSVINKNTVIDGKTKV